MDMELCEGLQNMLMNDYSEASRHNQRETVFQKDTGANGQQDRQGNNKNKHTTLTSDMKASSGSGSKGIQTFQGIKKDVKSKSSNDTDTDDPWKYVGDNMKAQERLALELYSSQKKATDQMKHDYDVMLKNRDEELERQTRLMTDITQKSDEITQQMSRTLQEKIGDKLIDTADKYSPTKIADMFHALYENQWQTLMSIYFEEDEVKGVGVMFELIKRCYTFCKDEAEVQIKKLKEAFQLSDVEDPTEQKLSGEDLWTDRRNNTLMTLRKEIQHDVKSRTTIKRKFWRNVETSKEVLQMSKTTESDLTQVMQFAEVCTECCWLMAISTPPIQQHYPELKKKLSESNSKYFGVYTTQDDVIDVDLDEGTVVAVVWPAIMTSDGRCVMKGDVVTVDKKISALAGCGRESPTQPTTVDSVPVQETNE